MILCWYSPTVQHQSFYITNFELRCVVQTGVLISTLLHHRRGTRNSSSVCGSLSSFSALQSSPSVLHAILLRSRTTAMMMVFQKVFTCGQFVYHSSTSPLCLDDYVNISLSTLFLVVGAIGLNIGFLIVQYLWFRKHKLHPGFMVWMQGWNVMVNLAVVALSLWSMIEWTADKWQIYEVVLLFYCFNA